MAYDKILAERVRSALLPGTKEQTMFGGLAFMIEGNMCCGVIGNLLVLRLGPKGTADALKEPHTREMDFAKKVIKSMIYVEPDGFASDAQLRAWLQKAIEFTCSLPPKT